MGGLFPLITMFSAGRNGTGKHNEIAGERVRTVDNDVGNVVLYQLSYARIGHFWSLYSNPSNLQDGDSLELPVRRHVWFFRHSGGSRNPSKEAV